MYDVLVIGGGHNGLVAAAYLAKAGLRVCVCEARDVVGGAAVSEHPFGPDYTVTSLSYVVSLLPPALVRDLRLDRHGYHVFPQGPYFAPRADGGHLRLPDDPARRREEIERFSSKDAAAYERWEARMDRLGAILGPELLRRIGVRHPAAQGMALGMTAHAVGTSRALQEGEECGAFAALAMSLMGVATAVLLPLAVALIA